MGKERLVRVRGGFSNWSNEDILKFAGFVQRFWRKKVDAESCRFIDLYSPVSAAFVMDTTYEFWAAINETDWWKPMCNKYPVCPPDVK